MNPLSALFATLFGAGVRCRNAFYDRGWARVRRLQGPVVSIGNLSAGGSGKTPFVMALGELLQARGVAFDVLSRGYGRSSRGVAWVDPKGTAREFGDEPLLIARRLGVPVVVGEDRYQAGCAAERRYGPRLHLLDDGFQHRQLARDFEIVLITPEDKDDQLLPAGRLREPLTALRRADAIVLTPGASPDGLPFAGHVWRVTRGLRLPPVPARPVAFCGIARPQRFFRQLREAGVEPVAEIRFRDHHAYTAKDIAALRSLQRQSGADGFITTEKDAINLEGLAPQKQNEVGELQPLAVVPACMTLIDAPAAVEALLSRIAERPRL